MLKEDDKGASRPANFIEIAIDEDSKSVGFGMFETLAILGRERSLARIDRALGRK